MPLSLDVLALEVPQAQAACDFYASSLSSTVIDRDRHTDLDLHGTGRISLTEAVSPAPARSGFPGYVLSYVVDQPSEVESLLDAAVRHGADILVPAEKGIFGGFSAVHRAPDGTVWKLSAPTRKDTGPARTPPVPTETGVLVGVADPRAAKAFYEAVGMTTDRDYGKKYVDFLPGPGRVRFGLMPRKALAEDAGFGSGGAGFGAAMPVCRAGSRDEVDSLLAAAAAAGGDVVVAAGETEDGYGGRFTDPDGVPWQVTS